MSNKKIFLINIGLVTAGISCLLYGTIYMWIGNDLSKIGVSLTAGVMLLLAGSLERFEMLKGLGVEAKMRTLDVVINDATATLEDLRSLATRVTEVTLTELINSYFLGGSSLQKRISMHDDLLETLKQLGASNTQVHEADTHWRKRIQLLYLQIIQACIAKKKELAHVNTSAPLTSQEASKKFGELFNIELLEIITPQKVTDFINEQSLMTDKIKEWIEDYSNYVTTGKINRVDKLCSALT